MMKLHAFEIDMSQHEVSTLAIIEVQNEIELSLLRSNPGFWYTFITPANFHIQLERLMFADKLLASAYPVLHKRI